MSTTHEGASEGSPDGDDGGSGGRMDSGGPRNHGDGGGGGGQRNFNNSRRKRRRQRPQRTKRHKGGGGGQQRSHAVKDDTDRERIFQDIEGLLRRIREEAEEAGRPEEELRDVTATVTNCTKILEEETEVVSERARVEYHRVREKLNHALRN
jgi:hypothetical protein